MKTLKKLYPKKIQSQIISTSSTIFVLTLALVLAIVLIQVRNSSFEEGYKKLKDFFFSIENGIKVIHHLDSEKLHGDINTVVHKIHDIGEVLIEDGTLKVGGFNIDDYNSIFNSIQKDTGTNITIFIKKASKLIAVTSTIDGISGKNQEAKTINSNSKIYGEINNGREYIGKDIIKKDYYISIFKPLKDANSNVIGAVSASIPMISHETKDYISKSKIGNGYFFILDGNHGHYAKGTYLLHPNSDLIKETTIYQQVEEFEKANHTEGFIEYSLNGESKTSYTDYIEEWDVYLGVGLNHDEIIGDAIRGIIKGVIITGLVAIIVAIISLNIMLKISLKGRLDEIVVKIKSVANGDYTQKFHSEIDDPIGNITNAIGQMILSSKKNLEEMNSSSVILSDSADELISVSKALVDNSENSTQIADETHSNTVTLADNTSNISNAMEQSTQNINMIAAAVEQMSSTIKNIAENTAKVGVDTQTANKIADETSSRVSKLGIAASEISKTTETISEISEQTNLLALNATIEAARAGEAGKGFAVVANEIKELAKQASEAAEDIKQATNNIQSETNITSDDVNKISEVISAVADAMSGVVAAVEEQSATTKDIGENISQASEGLTRINEEVANNTLTTNNIKEDISTVKDMSEEVKEGSLNITDAADNLQKMARNLANLVSQFKLN